MDGVNAVKDKLSAGDKITLTLYRSNAAAAGVQANDIITGINGTEVTDMDGVNAVKDKLSAGDKITLTLYRMSTGKTLTVSFALNDQHDLQGDDPALSQESEQSQYSH